MAEPDERTESDVLGLLKDVDEELVAVRQGLDADDLPEDELRARVETVAGRLQGLLAEQTGGYGAIDTHSGERVRPLESDPSSIELSDIAHALAHLSRFAGQGTEFYSVARHSVHVSREVEARGGSRAAQRWGLLHDATEAYLSDVPGPVKRTLPGYTHAESRLAATIRTALGLEVTPAEERLVDDADAAMARYELAAHFPAGDHEGVTLAHDPETVDDDAEAATLFRKRAASLELR